MNAEENQVSPTKHEAAQASPVFFRWSMACSTGDNKKKMGRWVAD